jgi:hypothetical protein
MASLNTFGAIMSFAAAMESRLAAYYQQAGAAQKAADADKRRVKLERARQTYVLEITLEAIEGLDEANYTFNLEDTSAAGQQAVAQLAAQFYRDVAPHINVRDAQRILEKAGKEHSAG